MLRCFIAMLLVAAAALSATAQEPARPASETLRQRSKEILNSISQARKAYASYIVWDVIWRQRVFYENALARLIPSRTPAIYANRSYFGVLRVVGRPDMQGGKNSLIHGATIHGLNYQDKKLRNLATTYYHQYGPAGLVMQKYNWFQQGVQEKSKQKDKGKDAVHKVQAGR